MQVRVPFGGRAGDDADAAVDLLDDDLEHAAALASSRRATSPVTPSAVTPLTPAAMKRSTTRRGSPRRRRRWGERAWGARNRRLRAAPEDSLKGCQSARVPQRRCQGAKCLVAAPEGLWITFAVGCCSVLVRRCCGDPHLIPYARRARAAANRPDHRFDRVRHVAPCRVPHAVDTARLASRLPAHPVTRFAPAPTGYLHLGHVLNAEYVWGLARALDGRVILRIEDHDRGRARPEFEAAILDDLDWLGYRSRHLHDGRLSIGSLPRPTERSR